MKLSLCSGTLDDRHIAWWTEESTREEIETRLNSLGWEKDWDDIGSQWFFYRPGTQGFYYLLVF